MEVDEDNNAEGGMEMESWMDIWLCVVETVVGMVEMELVTVEEEVDEVEVMM